MLVGIIILMIFIALHELGHAFGAKLVGVKVLRYSVGFGKKIFCYKDKQGTEWCLSLFPLGGYVKLLGADRDELTELSLDEQKVAYATQPVIKRAIIVLAGPLMNLLAGILFFWILYSFTGIPTQETVIGKSNIPFIQTGDRIIGVNGKSVSTVYDFTKILRQECKDKKNECGVDLTIKKDNHVVTISIFIPIKGKDELLNRVIFELPFNFSGAHTSYKYGVLQGAGLSVKTTFVFTGWTFKMFYYIITGKVKENFGGIFSASDTIGKAGKKGLFNFILILAVLNISLFAFNIFPLPVLDGGHLLFLLIEGVRGKPLSDKVIRYATAIGIGVIFALYAYSFYGDYKYFKEKINKSKPAVVEQK